MNAYPNHERCSARRRAGIGALIVLALVPAFDAVAQGFTLSQVPLVLPSALDPNIILTLEDSTNMRRAFAPDSMFSGAITGSTDPANTRRFKSSTFNPLYYDPNVRYVIPPNASNAVTSSYTQANISTAFQNAHVNGFHQVSGGTVNLTDGYRPTLSYDPTVAANDPGHVFADHATADLGNALPQSQVGATTVTGGAAAYYYVYDTSLAACSPAATSNDGCYRLKRVSSSPGPGSTDERLNFLIWYSFYRTRHLAMVSAAARVMNDVSLSGARVAWQGLNSCNSFSTGSTCVGWGSGGADWTRSNLIREFDNFARVDLMAWLRRVNANGSVPLRTALARAGDYYRSNGTTNNPYLKYPQLTASVTNPEYACRPNFHILIAGSAWDDASPGTYCSGGTCGDKDGTSHTLESAFPSGGNYPPGTLPTPFPYFDGSTPNSNSLADVAFHYWISDLRPDDTAMPDNKLQPYYADRTGDQNAQDWNPKNDPAQWQHMVNYVVGVGLKSTLGYVDANSTPPTNWGDTSTATGTGRLFDLWHAAVNGRGRFVGADTPSQVVDALTDSLGRAGVLNADNNNFIGASLATNSSRLSTDSALYQAQYSSADWTGRLLRIPVNADGSLGCVESTNLPSGCTDAADRIPTHSARRIFTSSGSTGVEFNEAGLTSIGAWNSFGADDNERRDVVDYIRGDQSHEQTQSGPYRNREKILGDIVNSDIVFSGGENFGYQDLCADNYSAADCAILTYTGTYSAYVTTKQSRPKMVYVGANDGMLHGFNADSMQEQFAYVPRSVLIDTVSSTDLRAALVQLTSPSYIGSHRYFVDGSPWVGDACLLSPAVNCTASDWRTVLVGTTGAGTKGVFALDVSNPSSFSASNVLWDLTAQGDVDLGYVIGQPVIGRLNDGNYYAIFGNGYLSTRGCPVLYLVNLATGAIRRLSAVSGNLGSGNSGTDCAPSNGLGRPSLFDDPGVSGSQPRTTDAIYAGDLQGNLWKFDVSSNNPGSWHVATGSGTPLFTARNKCGGIQPITGLIEIGVPPPGENTGAMLYFGTGRFLSADDPADTTRQSFYGIWDDRSTSRLNNPGAAVTTDTICPIGSVTTDSAADLSGRKKLQEQTLTAFSTRTDTNGVGGLEARELSTNTIDYNATGANAKNVGWYIDFPETGERMVSAPTLLAGRIVFPTLIPSAQICDGGGDSAVVAVNPFTGGKTVKNIFSVVNPVTYDSFRLGIGIVKNLIAVDSGTNVWLFAGGSSGRVKPIKTIAQQETGGSIRGRTAWREVFQ